MPEEDWQTVASEKVKSFRLKLRELDIRFKKTSDISGDKSAYQDWRDLFRGSDITFYLLRADLLLARDDAATARVRNDIRHLSTWLEEDAKPNKLIIIGTHCDLDPGFANVVGSNCGDYHDRFTSLPVINEARTLLRQDSGIRIVLGSLATADSTAELTYQALKVATE